jgi:hypothetical protein
MSDDVKAEHLAFMRCVRESIFGKIGLGISSTNCYVCNIFLLYIVDVISPLLQMQMAVHKNYQVLIL